MARKVRERLVDLIQYLRQPEVSQKQLTQQEQAVAAWLRADKPKIESLEALLRSRIEDRALLPVPSNPDSSHIRVAQDHEDRMIISWLGELYQSPVAALNAEGREDDDG